MQAFLAGNNAAAFQISQLISAALPKTGDAYNAHGIFLQQLTRYEDALKCFIQAITLTPDNADFHNNSGNVLSVLKRYDDALMEYARAIAIRPTFAEAFNNQANTFHELRRYEAALASCNRAIALKPDYPEAHNNRGLALKGLKQYDEALKCFDKAVAIAPNYAAAYNNRGTALAEMTRHEDALASYGRAIALKPAFAEAFYNRGSVFCELKQYEKALADYLKAMALAPEIPFVLGTVVSTAMKLCKWQGMNSLFPELAQRIDAGALSSLPLALLAVTSSAALQQQCAALYVKATCRASDGRWNGEIHTHPKTRIAYVSADFREHALARLMAGVFENHDKTRFEVYGIALAPEDASPTAQRVKASFDHFVDVSRKSDKEVAQTLRDLEVDIAVDLMGFTLCSRPNLFAERVAPVQINYLGYPATMGTNAIDYIIGDGFVIPPESRRFYSEKVIYLPDCFQANDDKRVTSKDEPIREAYGLPEDAFVFCCFNNSYKVNPDIFDVWMRLLKKVPGSVLWMLGSEAVEHNLRTEALNRGVEAARLVFAPRANYEEYLTRLKCADLYLDTLPFNGGATASDVLWAGVPLLTCVGEAFAARMAGSLLTAVELPELITEDLAAYEALACELATNSKKLVGMRNRLTDKRSTGRLFDTVAFTRHLESGYDNVLERARKGMPPDDIHVQG